MRTHKRGFTILVLFVVSYFIATFVLGGAFRAVAQEATPEPTPEAAAETTVEEAVVEEVAAEETPAEEAAEPAPTIEDLIAMIDTVWVLVAAFLVFFMQTGFALVEAGFVRAKMVVNILMKNFFDLSVGAIAYWAVGFGIMFGAGNAFFGTEWFFLSDIPEIYPGLTIPTLAFFFFQFAFAATAATIASGAMAGRTEFKGYLLYSLIVTALIYPIIGHWIWGGGWLAELGFTDFAGSTVVHSTGGWIGLIGAMILGPRPNRFGPDAVPMPGHSMTLATLGTFILWLGWFGFNPGSQVAATPGPISLITVNTNIAAAAGAISAMFLGWFLIGKPQLPWALNGALAGLVAITAPCNDVTPFESIIIGAIGGVVMYFGVNLLEKRQIDDVVGAVSVHGFAGVWGTLAVGIFGASGGFVHKGSFEQLGIQTIGIFAVCGFALATAFVMFSAINAVGWLRATKSAQSVGLDVYEHGMVAYPEFTTSPSEPVPYN
jgi:Amt family ammonium transporter